MTLPSWLITSLISAAVAILVCTINLLRGAQVKRRDDIHAQTRAALRSVTAVWLELPLSSRVRKEAVHNMVRTVFAARLDIQELLLLVGDRRLRPRHRGLAKTISRLADEFETAANAWEADPGPAGKAELHRASTHLAGALGRWLVRPGSFIRGDITTKIKELAAVS